MKHLKRLLVGAFWFNVLVGATWLLKELTLFLLMWQWTGPVFKVLAVLAFMYCIGGLWLAMWPILRGRR